MIIIMYFISPVDRTSIGICCNASFKFPKFRILVLSLISNSKGAGPSPKVPKKHWGLSFEVLCNRYGTIKIPPDSKPISAKGKSKFCDFRRHCCLP